MRAVRSLPKILTLGLALLLAPTLIWANSGDLYLTNESVYLSDSTIVNNQTVRIYATVSNASNNDLKGAVQFVNTTTGNQIGSDQAISALTGLTDTVFVDWTPSAGTYTVTVTVYPWDNSGDDPNNNSVSFTTTVDYDYDGDGVGNAQDPDDDNDDVPDTEDAFPLDENESKDTDGDGVGNNADEDDDNDGILDEEDEMPEDAGESSDTDGDGIGDNTDEDDDNDNLSDEYEIADTDPETGESKEVTDPLNPDTDRDTYNDDIDKFPLDEEEWNDNDNDGIGDNADPDDDNDELLDVDDEYPTNHGPVIVLEEYEEIDEATGERYLILDASKSYDPDGDSKQIIYRWIGKDGRLIGEDAIMELLISSNSLYPATLTLIDNQGESRIKILELGKNPFLQAMLWTLLLILLIALALRLYFKYTASASEKRPVKQVKKKPSKSSKRKPSKKR